MSVRILMKYIYINAMVGLCNMPWWVISCGLWSLKKSNWWYSFLDKNTGGSNIFMCFLTPLGVHFKSGVTGSNTNKSQYHHSYSTTICSTWLGEVLKSGQQQQICLNTTHCEVYGSQAGPRSQSLVEITKYYYDYFTSLLCFFFSIDYDNVENHLWLSACHIAESLTKNF